MGRRFLVTLAPKGRLPVPQDWHNRPRAAKLPIPWKRCVVESIWEAPRSRQLWSTASTGCSVRPVTPRPGRRPAGRGRGIAATLREAAAGAGAAVSDLAGVGVGSPGAIDDAEGTVTRRATSRTGRAPSRCAALGSRARRAGARSATTSRSRQGGVRARRRHASSTRCSASSGAPAWAAGSSSTASRGRARRGGRDRPHGGQVGGARCGCGRRGCMEAYAGRGSMEARARARRRGRQTELFEIMEKRGRIGCPAASGRARSTDDDPWPPS